VLTAVSEVIVIFLQLNLFPNTAVFFCSLLVLVSHSFEKATVVTKIARNDIASKRSITHVVLGLFQETITYKEWLFMPAALY